MPRIKCLGFLNLNSETFPNCKLSDAENDLLFNYLDLMKESLCCCQSIKGVRFS